MKEKEIQKIKEKLEKARQDMTKELGEFAEKDKKTKGDWNASFPEFQSSSTGQLEEAADEVEEYITLLPIEHSLETRIKNIDLALDKIKKGGYGLCEKCKKEIAADRLKAYPEAKLCAKCQKIKKRI